MEASGCSKNHIKNALIKMYGKFDEDYPEHRKELRRFLCKQKMIPQMFNPDIEFLPEPGEVGLYHACHRKSPKEEFVESIRGTNTADEVDRDVVVDLKNRGYSLGMIADMTGLTLIDVKEILKPRPKLQEGSGDWS